MAELDPNVIAPARLKLLVTLTAVSEVEFSTVRDSLEVSDSVLSKHLAALEDVELREAPQRRAPWPAHDLDLADAGRTCCARCAHRGAAGVDRRRHCSAIDLSRQSSCGLPPQVPDRSRPAMIGR